MINILKRFWPYLLLCVLLIPLVWPLIQPGFFVSDDGGWMVVRLSAFHQTLRSGQFPVRFLERLNHGYGYPVVNFLYPLPFYLGEIPHLLGFGFIDSVKILFLAGFILGGVFMYRYAGLAAAVVYSYAPYRIFDVYKRGSLGEAVAFIFLPLVFYFLDKKNIFWSAIFTAALITSHNVIAFIFLPIIFLYSRNIKLIIWSLLLSAFFWIPAIYDLQFTRAGQTMVANFSDYFLTGANFLQVGGLAIVAILAATLFKRKALFFLAVTLIALFFALPISALFWQILPLPRLVQFPWRFLTIVVFGAAVLAGHLAKSNKWLGVAAAALTVVLSLPLIQVERSFQPEGYYVTNDDTTTVKNEYMPKWVANDPTSQPPGKIQISPDGKTTQINTVYFPGWEVYVNGQRTPIDYQTNGFLRVAINNPSDKVVSVFKETLVRFLADLLTISGFIALIILRRKTFV